MKVAAARRTARQPVPPVGDGLAKVRLLAVDPEVLEGQRRQVPTKAATRPVDAQAGLPYLPAVPLEAKVDLSAFRLTNQIEGFAPGPASRAGCKTPSPLVLILKLFYARPEVSRLLRPKAVAQEPRQALTIDGKQDV